LAVWRHLGGLDSRLFIPFDRLGAECSAEPGAGLGLVVARALMAAMGGTLEIRNAAGAGTTAAITLPAARSGGATPR
jgi:signal transduction histidine kinase